MKHNAHVGKKLNMKKKNKRIVLVGEVQVKSFVFRFNKYMYSNALVSFVRGMNMKHED